MIMSHQQQHAAAQWSDKHLMQLTESRFHVPLNTKQDIMDTLVSVPASQSAGWLAG